MQFERFEMERFQSIWEHRVAWNVAESGVHPLRIEEVAETDAERVGPDSGPLGYEVSRQGSEVDDDLGRVGRERLAGPQGEGHPGPPGTVDVNGEGRVRLRIAVGIDAGFIDV